MQCTQPAEILLQAWLPARTYVKEAIETRQEVDDSWEIIKLSRYCPWKEHLYELEQELSVDPPIKFCIYEVRVSFPHAPRRQHSFHQEYLRFQQAPVAFQQAAVASQDTLAECCVSCNRGCPPVLCT